MPTRRPNPFTKRREPFQYLLWLGIVSSVFIFTVLLAVYIMRKSGPQWQDVRLPKLFIFSTVAISLSSFTLMMANRAFRTDRFVQYRSYMGTTLTLGVLFVILQLLGWKQLIQAGVTTTNNPSAGFVYILSGLHILHILGGIGALGWAFVESLKHFSYIDSFVYSVNPPNQLKIKLITVYWHFVDILWLYLFIFLLYHHGV